MLEGYEDYKETNIPWLSSVPKNWELLKIGELFTERREKVSDKEYAPLTVGKMGVVPQLDTVAKSNDGDNRKLVKSGDYVINSRSDRKGSSGLSSYDGSVSLINIVLTPRKGNGKYFHYLLKSYYWIEEYYRNGRGIVADLWTTRFSEMKSIVLPIPTISEQDRIVRYLDCKISMINKNIDAKKNQIELLKEQKQAVINRAVTKGLNFDVSLKDSGIDWLGKIPKHWEVRKLRYFCKFQNGISESGDFFITGTPFVNYTDVYKNFQLPLNVEGKASSTKKQQELFSVRKGDIFFTRTSETIGEIAYSSVCFEDIEKAIFSGFLIRVRQRINKMDLSFAKYYFRSVLSRYYFCKEMNLVTRVSLGQTLLKNMPVLLPPMEEQKKIGDYLESTISKINNLLENYEKEIYRINEYQTRLISDVVTGKVNVQGVEVGEVVV